MPANKITGKMKLTVARLSIALNLNENLIRLKIPDSHRNFLEGSTAEGEHASAVFNELKINLKNKPFITRDSELASLCKTEIWELWRTRSGEFLFIAPRLKPKRWALVDPEFCSGNLYLGSTNNNGEGVFPLQNLDMRIFVNWLANYNDLILHAAGAAIGGKGYAFIGSSGSGKSTLAETLFKQNHVTILGEDQVVLRYFDGRFWIFGTPWHERPEMCSTTGVPLEKLFILDRESNQVISNLSPSASITRILQTAFIPYYRHDRLLPLIDRLSLLSESIPIYKYAYKLGSDAVSLITTV